ncbi:hypothetical protein BTO18_04740 [Polaribacter porphyrae]|uniref:Uncharacterized protein n=2 Tax=Polaribacter porphyrae TaxID=1137780 RepID=A0A2S7WLP9_9FLAO|nr:hypothetical protein [Polaribacter porphyrae]PQJ78534.1 hypothetical protein BTO18_04740 [Polaribacter porphyrae]
MLAILMLKMLLKTLLFNYEFLNYLSNFVSIKFKDPIMLDFSEFSGLVLFMFIFTAGFWLLIFLLTFVVPYWIGGTIWENFKLKREAKKAAEGK